MKRYVYVFLTVMTLIAVRVNGFASKITDVTVYKNSALITRVVKIPSMSTNSIVKVDNLPYFLDDNSIQILSSKNITVNSFDIKTIYPKNSDNETVKKLKKKLKLLKNKFLKYKNHMYVIEEKRKFLDAVRENVASQDKTQNKPVFDWRGVYRFFGTSIDSLLTDSLRTAMIIGDIESRMNELKNKINQYAPTDMNHKSLTVNIDKNDDKEGTITVRYVVNNASWKPYYRLDIENSDGKYELMYLAKIKQNTGEDWNNVKLTVSTSSPEIPSYATHVSPWYLYPYRSRKTNLKYESMDKLAAAPMREKSMPEAEVGENLYSVIFTLRNRITIPSMKSEKTVLLADIKGKGELSLFASPIVSKYVYAHIDFVNHENFSLLPGKADILWDGDYNGKGYIPATSRGDTVSIECGADKEVTISRELVEHKFDKGNRFSKFKSYYFKYATKVLNRHNRKIKITVEDRIPVSKDKDIKVTNVKILPGDYTIAENGIVKFTLDIPAKKEKKLFVEYKIVMPKGINSNGLF